MSPPLVSPLNTPDWFCTCRKCGTNGKVLARTKWYRHNPGGKKAKYPGLSNKEIKSFMRINPPARPGTNAQKRQLDKEDEEDEEPPRISK